MDQMGKFKKQKSHDGVFLYLSQSISTSSMLKVHLICLFPFKMSFNREIRCLQSRAGEEAAVAGGDSDQEVHQGVQVELHAQRGQPVPRRQSRGGPEGGEGRAGGGQVP